MASTAWCTRLLPKRVCATLLRQALGFAHLIRVLRLKSEAVLICIPCGSLTVQGIRYTAAWLVSATISPRLKTLFTLLLGT